MTFALSSAKVIENKTKRNGDAATRFAAKEGPMAEKNPRRNPTTDALFDAILSLETREECYNFFEDLCTVKEISDMAQRLEAAKLLLGGSTYDQIVKAVEISTATISRINRCIQYGSGGYRDVIEKTQKTQ